MALQLLVREYRDGHEELEAVGNPQNLDPEDLEASVPGSYAPLLGTVDLVGLIASLQARGYRFTRLELRDARLAPLTDDVEELLQSHLPQHALRREKSAWQAYLDSLPDWVLVTGFEVADSTGIRLRVIRNGGVLAPTEYEIDPFLAALMDSWAEVRGVG